MRLKSSCVTTKIPQTAMSRLSAHCDNTDLKRLVNAQFPPTNFPRYIL